MRGLGHIRKVLDPTTANTIACSIIGSRLDYCNAVLAGVSAHSINRLQLVQNSAARVVLNAARRSSATDLLRELHWLPIVQRIDFKVALLTFKALSCNEPKYLCNLVKVNAPIRSTRSSSSLSLTQPFCSTALASRAFSIYAPRLWNNLPKALRDTLVYIPSLSCCDFNALSVSVDSFKRSLKTVFFNRALNCGAAAM